MELSENETIERYPEQRLRCTRILLLPYEYEWTCFSCGYIVIKRKNQPKIQRKKIIYQSIEIC